MSSHGEQPTSRGRALLLSLVHPDFLPSVYSLSFVLRDRGHNVHVVSFSSPAQGQPDLGGGIVMHDCGPYHGSTAARARARRRFSAMAADVAAEHPPAVIIATCPFSFLEATRIRPRQTPVVYYMLETYDVGWGDLLRSPLTTLRSWRARRRLAEADLVCTPSPERSGWVAGLARMRRLPSTVLNSPSYAATSRRSPDPEVVPRLLPEQVRSKALVIHTGAVSATQGVVELVESVANWPAELGLVVTNVGNGAYGNAVRDAVARSSRQGSIVLLPMISRREMLALQVAASVGVCLLRSGDNLETVMPAPNKVGEYLHSGLTIVGLRMPYLEQLEMAGVAVLADELRPDSIAAAVTKAWTGLVRADGKARALSLSRTWYCMETQARPILRLIENGARDGR